MTTIQTLERKLTQVTQDYGQRLTMLEDQIDELEATLAYHETRNEETFPYDMVKRLTNGENAVKVYREHRGWTQEGLAEQSGIGRTMIAQIETGKKTGSTQTLKKLAKALHVDLEDLA